MPTTTITMTDTVARRVAALVAATDQPVEAFIERVLRGLAETDADGELRGSHRCPSTRPDSPVRCSVSSCAISIPADKAEPSTTARR